MNPEKPENKEKFQRNAVYAQRLKWVMLRISKDNIKAVDVVGMVIAHFHCSEGYAKWLVRRSASEVAAQMLSQAHNPIEVGRYISESWCYGEKVTNNVIREGASLLMARFDAIDPWPVCANTFLSVIRDKNSSSQNKTSAARALLEMSPRFQAAQKADVNINLGGSTNVIQQIIQHVESGDKTEVVDVAFIEEKVAEALKLESSEVQAGDETDKEEP